MRVRRGTIRDDTRRPNPRPISDRLFAVLLRIIRKVRRTKEAAKSRSSRFNVSAMTYSRVPVIAITVYPKKKQRMTNDKRRCTHLKVVSPVGTDGSLPTDIPKIKIVALVRQCLDLESQSRRDGIGGFPT